MKETASEVKDFITKQSNHAISRADGGPSAELE